jgi:type IV secretion system protein VirB9
MTRPGAITDIALDPSEILTALAVGDTVQWISADTAGHVFIKPLRPGLFTTATVVTDKRVYQLSLRSSQENGLFYQRVSWVYPDFLMVKKITPPPQNAPDVKPNEKPEQGGGLSTKKLDDMNFDYDISGDDVQFKPTQVMDDGKFVWLQMPRNSQEQPALFIETEGGLSLANYNTNGRYLVVTQLFKKAVLKIGSEEVSITRRGKWWD